ncbi:phosphotransferase family protein [Cohnella thailandensis]|uniref:Aminoglycoside phosphotransferase family protein n=1 Tax=Cohnella thailandensis TaxID=557557 RepID=A0A841T2M7_9BACL|nr:aminoglycoside phosphotransferase family protein [Cohnella thailandensis]MBB6638394.1 aminoglycoside phosphotransferase family protein [Cohnella thailandensis]MBP1977128.1 aminoglycoside phosphotransferase (APT) family kinase protein [Cohnella thailandensis]
MKLGALIGVGNTASVYEWGSTEVIKLFHDCFDAASEAGKEARNAEIVDGLNVRTPRFSGLVEHEGKPGLVYERIEGKTMLRQIESTAESIDYHAKLMAQLQFELHQVRVRNDSNLKKELENRLNWTEELNDGEKRQIRAILASLPEGNALCHYDFHPDNIILSPNGPVIIDWMNVLIGDPAADVARSSMILQSTDLPSNAPEWLANGWLSNREYRVWFYEQYWREYQTLSGMLLSDVEQWMVPTIAARIIEVDRVSRGRYLENMRSRLAR